MNNKIRYLSHIPGSYTVRFEEEKNCLDTNKIKSAYDESVKAYSLIIANGEALYMIRDGTMMGTFVPEGELSDAFKWTFELNKDGTYQIWNKLNNWRQVNLDVL